jgi:hypothetical protein
VRKKTVIAICWCIITMSVTAYGQRSTNPFELEPRLPDTEVEAINPNDTGNPFDIIPPDKEVSPVKSIVSTRKKQVKSIDVPTTDRRLLLIMTTVLLLLLTILVTLFRSQLYRTYRAFLNDNLLSQLQRERETVGGTPYYLFYIFFMLTLGVFIYLIAKTYQVPIWPAKPWYSLGLCLAVVPAFFISKHLVLNILGGIFPIEKEIRLYSLTIIVFSIVLGICLLPVNLLLAFAPDSTQEIVVYVAIFIIAGIYIFRTLRGLFIGNKFLLFHKFHFLLYICTVELAPIAIIVKLLLG